MACSRQLQTSRSRTSGSSRVGRVPGDDDHAEHAVDHARPASGDPARPQSGPAHLAVGDQGARGGDHPVAVEVRAPAELDAVAEDRDGRVEPAELVPDRGADQHPAGGDAQPGLRLVPLALVDLARVQLQVAAAGAGDADPDLADLLAGLPASGQQQLRSGDVDGAVGADVGEQLVERVRLGLRVVVQQPQPVALLRAQLGVLAQGGLDRGAEAVAALAGVDGVDQALGDGLVQQVAGAVGAVVVDRDQPGRPVLQPGQAVQGVRQPSPGVEGDQDRGDPEAREVERRLVVLVLLDPGPGIGVARSSAKCRRESDSAGGWTAKEGSR